MNAAVRSSKDSKVPAKAAKATEEADAKPEKPSAKRAVKPKVNVVPAEQRANYIEVVAYHIAERRAFAPGNPVDDWLAAEAEVDVLIRDGKLGG